LTPIRGERRKLPYVSYTVQSDKKKKKGARPLLVTLGDN